MRLRRLELAVLGLTLAFVCFIGGYFTGSKGAVNIVPVSSDKVSVQGGGTQQGGRLDNGPATGSAPGSGAQTAVATGAETDRPESPGIAQPAAESGAGENIPVPESVPAVRNDGRININKAMRGELTDLPGIGAVIAERIIVYRESHGPFLRIEDIRNVSGIGEKKFEAIKDKITVG